MQSNSMMNKQAQQQFFQGIIEQHKGILFKVASVAARLYRAAY